MPEQSVFVAGLMLYLAEGDKKNDASISLSNADPEIVRFFMQWLEHFLDIPMKKIKVALHLYEGMNIVSERKFWMKELGTIPSQFYKDQIRPFQKDSFSYHESFRHGSCKIYFHSVHRKMELMLSIRAFLDTYSERRVARRRKSEA